jgi:uncharacterized membrane protein
MLDVLIKHPEDKDGKRKILKFSDRADKPIKSILKSVSWRIVGTIDTMVISYFITGKVTMAVTIGSVEVITKTVLYYFHERIWAHVHRLRLKLRVSILNRHYGRRFKIKRTKIPA